MKANDDTEVTLPGDIQRALAQIDFHRTRKGLREVQAVYSEDPAYVQQWLQHLAHTRAGDPRAAGVFRQVVLRERTPFAGTGREPGRNDCPECHGGGVVKVCIDVECIICGIEGAKVRAKTQTLFRSGEQGKEVGDIRLVDENTLGIQRNRLAKVRSYLGQFSPQQVYRLIE